MHPDRKIGFAMGILLIGIVGALFFRNEPLLLDDAPTVRRESALNDQLRARDVAVYLDDGRGATTTDPAETPVAPAWTMPELVKELDAKNGAVPLPVGMTPSTIPQPLAADLKDDFQGPEQTEPAARPLPSLFPEMDSSIPSPVAEIQDSGTVMPEIPTEFDEYIVRYGDTLSQIAEKFLGSQARFQEIYDANRDRIAGPDRLQVGKAIRIPRQSLQ